MNRPPISSKSFQTGFHLFVGLLMALAKDLPAAPT